MIEADRRAAEIANRREAQLGEMLRQKLIRGYKLDRNGTCAIMSITSLDGITISADVDADVFGLGPVDLDQRVIVDHPLIHISSDARRGMAPCGECHIRAGETCDVCGAKAPDEYRDDTTLGLDGSIYMPGWGR